ncbi:hypothetical protein FKM82_012826 [Ascaphus truei]
MQRYSCIYFDTHVHIRSVLRGPLLLSPALKGLNNTKVGLRWDKLPSLSTTVLKSQTCLAVFTLASSTSVPQQCYSKGRAFIHVACFTFFFPLLKMIIENI